MADRRELTPDLETAMRLVFENLQAGLWTALPAIINSYDAAAGTCKALPTIKCRRIDENGAESWVSIPLLVDVPVVFPSGGGFSLTFPVKPDDECLVVFSSRCIDAWWDLGPGPSNDPGQVQTELRMHDLSDGFAIVGPRSKPRVIAPTPRTDAVEIRADDGSSFVRIDESGHVKLTADNNVEVNAGGNIAAVAAGNVSVQAGGTAAVTSAGSCTITAPTINLVGNIVHTGTFLSNGLPAPAHRHTETGGTTLGPIV